ncbi:hypothetical protein IAT40_004865 [Kwoniella sp. CBS 6097]
MSSFAGALGSKRKNDLIEIADALGITDTEARVVDLVKNIQATLDEKEDQLAKDPRFRGLYYKKRASGTHPPDSDSDSPSFSPAGASADVKAVVSSTVKSGRKSLSKAADRLQNVVDAANLPLPESPIALSKVADVVESAVETAAGAVDTVSQALVPSSQDQRVIATRFHEVSSSLIKYTKDGQVRVDHVVRHLRDLLSTPQKLVTASLALELVFLLTHVIQFYDHTYYFPPAPGESGTIASLLHILFFWLPSAILKFRLPELRAFRAGDVWSAVAWWFFSTVIPPYALSTIVPFVPQKGVARHAGAHTRYQSSHPPTPTADPLSFTLIRLALLILPLTSAAPSSLVDALEISGNLQARALGAGLTAALVLSERIAHL